MKKKSIFLWLDTAKAVTEFIERASTCNAGIDLVSDEKAVDGKSILGVFSLDLHQPLECVIYSTCDDDIAAAANLLTKFTAPTTETVAA